MLTAEWSAAPWGLAFLSTQHSALSTVPPMAKEMLINVSEGEECRIALLADGKLEELYMERTSSTSHVGNIYKGKVCLLYTSPSPRDGLLSRMPSSA